MAGGRGIAGGGRPHPLRSFSSYRVFASALLTLLLLASLSLLFSSSSHPLSPPSSPQNPNPNANPDPLFLALRSDPHLTRLHLLRRQASDHLALVRAYSSFALRLKLSSSHNLQSFLDLSLSLSDLVRRLPLPPIDEESLRPFEKDIKDKLKLARLLVSQSKESFDTQLKIQKLRDTIFAVSEHLSKAKKLVHLSSSIAASSTPKSIHCLNMRLMEHLISNPSSIPRRRPYQLSADPNLLHFAIFSDNVLAVSVVINSAIKNAEHPSNLVFHVVTDKMYLPAMQVWFARRPPTGGAHVDLRSVAEFPFLNSTYSPLIRQAERQTNNLPVLDYLRFYLPEMFPGLKRIVLLEDDVVVQKDLAGLWKVDLDGKVNAAVEMCFGGFRRYSKYMNFSNPEVRERFSPRTCAWGFGVNVFDLDAWRREQCTDNFHRYMSLNEDGTLWQPGSVLPAGLMTFYTLTKPLDKSWHVMGLGYNPSVSQDEIRNAAVVHFNGNMKPWLDVAMNQYKHLWTKYVDTEMEYLPLCNFGL